MGELQPLALFNAAHLVGDRLAELIQLRILASASAPRRIKRLLLAISQSHAAAGASGFFSAAALYATWGHEAIHHSHSSRLARDLSGVMGSAACTREELVTELGPVLFGDRLEIGSDVARDRRCAPMTTPLRNHLLPPTAGLLPPAGQ